MNKNPYEKYTDEKLLKIKSLLKGVCIGFGIIALIAISIIIYILATKGFKNISIAIMVPLFTLPLGFTPIFIILSLINKEIKSRNLN
ncbi:MAG: hypothetical protein H7339_04760 [Arcicella sp.]|nr:hypothetical protein [Arcicella sp.]